MADIAFLAVVTGFFIAAAGFVGLCDRIIGPAEPAASPPTSVRAVEPPAATAA